MALALLVEAALQLVLELELELVLVVVWKPMLERC